MKIVRENNNVISYQDEIQGQVINVDYKKDNKEIVIKVEDNVLSREDYLIIIGKIYKVAANEIKDFQDIHFEFYPINSDELERVQEAIKEYGINNQTIISPSVNRKEQMIENYFNANIISKNDNGRIVNYAVRQADSTGGEYLLENVNMDLIRAELREMVGSKEIDIDTMTESQITNMVLDKIANDRKQHLLNSQDKYEAKNEYEHASLNATREDDLVNTEIGVVKKNPEDTNSNTYRTVERDGDNYVVSNPSVNEVRSIEVENNNPELTQDEVEVHDEEKIYYVDTYTGDIYNQNDELIGNLRDGYVINEENHLLLNDKDLGLVDDIKSKDKSMEHENVKVRRLEKPKDNDSYGLINIKSFITILGAFIVLFVIYIVLYLNR